MHLKIIGILMGAAFILSACTAGMKAPENKFAVEAAQRGLWKEATFYWERLVKKYPNVAKFHNNLAIAYENAGRYEEALKEYQIALKLDPGNSIIKKNYNEFREFYLKIEEKKKEKKREKK